jgi:hypothetical protein
MANISPVYMSVLIKQLEQVQDSLTIMNSCDWRPARTPDSLEIASSQMHIYPTFEVGKKKKNGNEINSYFKAILFQY